MTNYLRFIELDFRTMRPYWRSFLAVLFILLVFTATSMAPETLVVTGALMGPITVMSYLFSQDARLDILYGLLPISRRDAVIGRYLDTLGFTFAGTILGLVFAIASGLITGNSLDGIGFGAISGIACALVLNAIQMPVYYRFGYTRARILSIAIIVVAMALLVGMVSLLGFQIATVPWVSAAALIALPVIAVLLYLASAALSLKWYQAREF